MLVDDPKKFFNSLCMLKGKKFNSNDYRYVLASLTNNNIVSDTMRDTYFYLAHIFNLISETDNRNYYEITESCEKICAVVNDDSKQSIYKQYIKGMILSNNDKGQLFNDFLDFISTPKTIAEIEKRFKKVPTKTLIAFSLEAGLILHYGELYQSTEIHSNVDLNIFYFTLIKEYKKIQEKGTRKIYVSIDLIRNLVSLELGLESLNLFNSLLEQALDSPLGVHLYLHGAAPQSDSEYIGFRYKGKRYVFISIR
jgi:hypothetical protein